MPQVKGEKILPYAPEKIFGVVMDIENYPKVLSFIRNVEIVQRNNTETIARVFVGFKPLEFSYMCKITSIPFSHISITATDGPFKHLKANWNFEEIGENKTKVSYELNSQFKSRMMEVTGGMIFAQQLHQSIKAFEDVLRKS